MSNRLVSIYLFQNLSLFVQNITSTSSGTPAFHKLVLLFDFTKSIVMHLVFGEPHSFYNFVKDTFVWSITKCFVGTASFISSKSEGAALMLWSCI